MDNLFKKELELFSERINSNREKLENATEEATKHSLVLPFLAMLDYDVFSYEEVIPEYTADIGNKTGEKVDYAIKVDGKVEIIVECKKINSDLNQHASQLFRYFNITEANLGILTNGIIYKIYSDLNNDNHMDKEPFYEADLSEIISTDVEVLDSLRKQNFNANNIIQFATRNKRVNDVEQIISRQIYNPDDGFLRFIHDELNTGRKFTSGMREELSPIVRKALFSLIEKRVTTVSDAATTAAMDVRREQEQIIPNIDVDNIVQFISDICADLITDKSRFKVLGLPGGGLRIAIDKRNNTICTINVSTGKIKMPDVNGHLIPVDLNSETAHYRIREIAEKCG